MNKCLLGPPQQPCPLLPEGEPQLRGKVDPDHTGDFLLRQHDIWAAIRHWLRTWSKISLCSLSLDFPVPGGFPPSALPADGWTRALRGPKLVPFGTIFHRKNFKCQLQSQYKNEYWFRMRKKKSQPILKVKNLNSNKSTIKIFIIFFVA